ncbi:MAG: 50S ribosomal protein L19 [Elusimicrobia bacterium]|nr:50S ribosomal protein L19 [Elusimicrobiota bacterium]
MKKKFDSFKVGDTVSVVQRIKEGESERKQTFKGVVIAIKGKNPPKTFTVRKVSYGVEIEKVFPYALPTIQEIRVETRGRIRRAKLYYLRGRKGRAAKIKEAS